MSRRQKSAPNRIIPISVSPINSDVFAPFGDVVHNPSLHPETTRGLSSVSANQGTATKWLDVSHMDNHYALAPSKKPARAVMNMFVCEPRSLYSHNGRNLFPLGVLERHPYTPQTFIPLGTSPQDQTARYLIVVAPTLPARARDSTEGAIPPYPTPTPRRRQTLTQRLLSGRPNLFTNDFSPTTTPPISSGDRRLNTQPKGPGEPDLDNIKAFIVRGDQAITYGPGTWHAPMVVLGERPIDFVVVQHANDVPLEDCQEIDIVAEAAGGGILIDVEANRDDSSEAISEEKAASGAGIMRAKL